MIAALALAALAQAHGPEPGPRLPLAGLAGVQIVSRLDFGTARNRLTADYVFPDRARWHFEDQGVHHYLYRHGERVREFRSSPSRELQDEDRDVVLLQMELRRAVLLWPDGFDWQSQDSTTSVAAVLADSCCRERSLGSLCATLEDGRPRRIEVRDGSERTLETLVIHAWQEHAGRSWPRTLELVSASGGFTETVESIETRVHFLELSFLPPDLRPLRKSAEPGPVVGALDLVAMTYATHPLPAGTDWDQAAVRARAWIAEASIALKAQGVRVDPIPTFELSPEGRPARCLVRLSAALIPPPKGFETKGERAGLFALLQAPVEIDARTLARLVAAASEDTRPGTAYVRMHARKELPIELVLPLEARD